MSYAEVVMAQGDFQKATSMVADVVSRVSDPKQTLAVADLAVMIDDLDNAEAAYKKAQSVGANPERVERGLAQVTKLRQQALEDVKVAGELLKKKQHGGAAERYRNAISINPKLADARLGLAQTLEKSPKPTASALGEAAQQYRNYVALKTDLPEKDKQKLLVQADKLGSKAAKLGQKRNGRM